MWRYIILFTLTIFFASSTSIFCQGLPLWYRTRCVPPKDCVSSPQPPPITRTVQVDMPAPCPPSPCRVPVGRRQLCGPRPCSPPCPTRPVNVRVEVVVRPEAKKPCLPQRFCCENPPVFEPFFSHAAWMLRSMILAPLGIGENIFGHGVPRMPCPPPTPIACPPYQVRPRAGFVQTGPRPMPQFMPPYQPAVRGALPGPSALQQPNCPPLQTYRGYRGSPDSPVKRLPSHKRRGERYTWFVRTAALSG